MLASHRVTCVVDVDNGNITTAPHGYVAMPKKKPPRSVEADVLETLRRKGVESDILDARLAWTELEGIRRYIADMAERDRIFPLMLPTSQAGGRWSTTSPPLTNWPRHDISLCSLDHQGDWCSRDVRGVLVPDPGTYWLKFDWSAVEARLAALYCQDEDDLRAFRDGLDIHTITACRMFGLPLPPVQTSDLHTSPAVADWRASVRWGGGEDARRHMAKTARYALLYAEDHRGILNAKGVEKLGYTRKELEEFGRAYLRAKPSFVAAKSKAQQECARTGLARTGFGRLRRLSGDLRTRAKEGFSHMISGTVSDMMNLTLIGIHAQIPACHLVVNRHDGAEIAFPDEVNVAETLGSLRSLVEREWTFWGHSFTCPASWCLVRPDGSVEKV